MSLPHDSAVTHVSGESEFIDDRPRVQGELWVEVVTSPLPHAKIKALRIEDALRVPGVVGIFTAKDLAHNKWGTIFQDQPILADVVVSYVGEVVAVIAAESIEAARRAKKLVKLDLKPLPAILSIADARKKESFIGSPRMIARGDVQSALISAPLKLEGSVNLRGADHFYLESQVAIAYPKESGQLEVHSSTQHPTEVQHLVAEALGLHSSEVVCIVKRMGGAFGGKESQAAPFAAYAALAAHRLKRAARIVLSKDEDMVITGKRNPFENFFRVGFDEKGRILVLDVELFSDGGAYADLSTAIMERAMLHIDNAYYIPHIRVQGRVCRTHFHPHTAFRGFGGPKGMATIERIIEEIAHALKMDPLDVRKLNCYQVDGPRSITHYGQTLENNLLPKLFSDLENESKYRERREAISRENALTLAREHTGGVLKGLSLTPVKFGISFTTRFLNQANALVIVHRDGSIQVSTGATEMGQGVNARIAELVASEFGVSRSVVKVMPTSTEKNGNTSPTAASSGTDLNGAAAVIAARKIRSRLALVAKKLLHTPKERWPRFTAPLGTEPEIEEVPGQTTHDIAFENGVVFASQDASNPIFFADVVNEAYLQRISLSEYAHYKFPHLGFDKLKGQGRAFLYYTQGVAVSEVAIDRITGEAKVLAVDILMDLGRPINEGLDLGQITGAFVQGQGWVTTEKLYYTDSGALASHSPSTYKIPNIQDTPRTFNVRLIENSNNRVNIRGTKAAGEPPLMLALSVWTAIHDALRCLPRYEKTFPRLELPATQEQILRAMWS